MYPCLRDLFVRRASAAGGSRLIALAPIAMALIRMVAVACSTAVVEGLAQGQNLLTPVFILLALASSVPSVAGTCGRGAVVNTAMTFQVGENCDSN